MTKIKKTTNKDHDSVHGNVSAQALTQDWGGNPGFETGMSCFFHGSHEITQPAPTQNRQVEPA